MNIATIREAIAEAERFMFKAEAALQRQRVAQERFRKAYPSSIHQGEVWDTCPENAACKRASMDLTRALAKLRKS